MKILSDKLQKIAPLELSSHKSYKRIRLLSICRDVLPIMRISGQQILLVIVVLEICVHEIVVEVPDFKPEPMYSKVR